MRRILFTVCILAGLQALSAKVVSSQNLQSFPLLEGSTMRIDGTSNKSDWSVEVTGMQGMLWGSLNDDGVEPDSVFFVTKSGDLKSGKSTIMDRLMYKALKSTEYPEIVYTLSSSGVVSEAADDTLRWSTSGALWLAGVSDTLAATVAGFKDSDGRHVFTGAHRMSMRQHEITPPTAMFGALHTSEWVTIVFRLVFGEAVILEGE